MKDALIVVSFYMVALLALSCGGGEGAGFPPPSPSASPPSPSPIPASWPVQRHSSMEAWDRAHASMLESWRAAPTAPPLVSALLSVEEALDLAEQVSERIPPTPLPRPFQTPARVELPPPYEDPFRAAVEGGEQGLRVGFLADGSIMQDLYWIHPGETLAGWLFFGHYIYPPPAESAPGEDYRLFCLLDYRQISFRFDGVEGVVHDFHMGPNEERAFRLEFHNLPQGVHRLICPYYVDPDAFPHSWDIASYEAWTRLSFLGGATAMDPLLLVGAEEPPEVTYTLLPGSLPATADLHDALMVNRSAAAEDAWRDWAPQVWENGWLVEWGPLETAPGERLEAVLRANNCDEQPFRFGVTAFLDYRQIPLQVEDSDPVSWYELPPGRQETIPLSFVTPLEPGPHIYFIMEFRAPYEPVALYEWVGDTVRFPWIMLETGEASPQGWFVPNIRFDRPAVCSFDREPLLIIEEAP